jgi:FKBP-type peptidyl-prolyl cis-trans isomerase FklB
MKYVRFALPLALLAMGTSPAMAQQPNAAAASNPLSSPQGQTSYALGVNIGSSLRADGIAIDGNAFLKGVQDAIANAKPAMSEQQMSALLSQLQSDIRARRIQQQAKAAATNKAEGEAFLKTNGTRPGVKTLPSGLQYQVLTAGTGPVPKPSDTVVCNYRGTLIDGTEFDSSAKHGGPASFPVEGVIGGWTEALQLMPVGSKWRLFVPAALAYGERGAGEDIGPNAVLVFDIELISIAKD